MVVGVLSNLAFKGAMAALLGDARLRRFVAIVFGLQLLAGAVMLAVWLQISAIATAKSQRTAGPR